MESDERPHLELVAATNDNQARAPFRVTFTSTVMSHTMANQALPVQRWRITVDDADAPRQPLARAEALLYPWARLNPDFYRDLQEIAGPWPGIAGALVYDSGDHADELSENLFTPAQDLAGALDAHDDALLLGGIDIIDRERGAVAVGDALDTALATIGRAVGFTAVEPDIGQGLSPEFWTGRGFHPFRNSRVWVRIEPV